MNTTTATYLVNTTNCADIPAGFVQLSANLRETKDFKPTAEQKYRNVLIKEFTLPTVEEKFRPVLLDKLYSLAKERFEADMETSNRLATTVNQEDYTISGVLAFYATDAKSGRMSKEMVGEWFDNSATGAKIRDKAPAKVQSYKDNYCKLASPNHGINPNTCRALLATLVESDLSSAVAVAIASKLQATITKSEASQVEAL